MAAAAAAAAGVAWKPRALHLTVQVAAAAAAAAGVAWKPCALHLASLEEQSRSAMQTRAEELIEFRPSIIMMRSLAETAF